MVHLEHASDIRTPNNCGIRRTDCKEWTLKTLAASYISHSDVGRGRLIIIYIVSEYKQRIIEKNTLL